VGSVASSRSSKWGAEHWRLGKKQTGEASAHRKKNAATGSRFWPSYYHKVIGASPIWFQETKRRPEQKETNSKINCTKTGG